ncbi:conjugal transfer protein TrbP [uncultured Eubacterium sp.]|nr:conjugal transfer protein TrbP [uncultured Eubacterium sp.]
MLQEKNQGFLTGSTLKWIAITAMFINHFGDIVLEGVIMNAPYSAFTDAQFQIIINCYEIFHAIGRISMPIFCFLIVEGFVYTRDVKRYLTRLFLFAIISEVPYDLASGTAAFDLAQQNVFFTLAAGLLVLMVMKRYREQELIMIAAPIIIAAATYYLKFDGSYYGVLMMVLFYLLRGKRLGKCAAVFALQIAIMMVFSESFDLNQVLAALPLIAIYFYNGRRGMKLKYFFYIFYPCHLLVLALVTKLAVIPAFM